MTRDEAIKIANRLWGSNSNAGIDTLVALGVLKLDEPEDKAFQILRNQIGIVEAHKAIHALMRAGLKIVEKQQQ